MRRHHDDENAPFGTVENSESFLGMRLFQHHDLVEQPHLLLLKNGDMLSTERLTHIGIIANDSLRDVACQIHEGGSAWRLTQHSQTVGCVVNDAALMYQQTVVLREGDRIELGPLQLIVVGAMADDEPIASANPFDDDEKSRPEHDLDMNPFAHLPHFRPDRCNETLRPYASAPSGQDVIDELADEYMMAIMDPGAIDQHQTTTIIPFGAHQLLSVEHEREREIPTHFSLEDMVTGQLGIDQVLARIGMDDAQWDKLEGHEDVLMLFADGMLHRARQYLPHLTRREHHAISPDSHVDMARTGNDRASPDISGKTISPYDPTTVLNDV